MKAVAKKQDDVVSALILNGDLSKLSSDEKIKYYNGYCERMGLDPYTKPFDLLRLNGREILYCTRSGAQQLNKLHQVSHAITSRELIDAAGIYQVTARASLPDGRFTESIGATNIGGLKGENYANAIMKAETKAKRRSTLDLLGLGVLDETEVETIAVVVDEKVKEKQQEKQIEAEFTEVEALVRKKYDNEDDLLLVLDSVETLSQITNLYHFNQHLVSNNKTMLEHFKNKKNEINSKPAA